ncbi:MAG: hypothetical protein PARBB_01462 [Parabacteroides distasonis]
MEMSWKCQLLIRPVIIMTQQLLSKTFSCKRSISPNTIAAKTNLAKSKKNFPKVSLLILSRSFLIIIFSKFPISP